MPQLRSAHAKTATFYERPGSPVKRKLSRKPAKTRYFDDGPLPCSLNQEVVAAEGGGAGVNEVKYGWHASTRRPEHVKSPVALAFVVFLAVWVVWVVVYCNHSHKFLAPVVPAAPPPALSHAASIAKWVCELLGQW